MTTEVTTAPQTETIVNITEEASQEVKKLLAEEPDKSGLRLEVRGGGCSGFSYGLTFDNPQ